MRPTNFPFLTHSRSREDKTAGANGGIVETFTAAAALNTGDVVFFSAANTVNKSATTANYAGFAGVVVGGRATGGNIVTRTGIAAAATGQEVLVQVSGVATVVAEGTITMGTHFSVICTGTTPGRVIAGTTAGQMLGTPVTSGASGAEMQLLIRHR